MLFRIIGLLTLALTLLSAWAWHDYQEMLVNPTVTGNPVTIEIIKGDSFNQITDKLMQQKVNLKHLPCNKKSLINYKQANTS